MGVVVFITGLYNLGVEGLKKEEDWPRVWLAFTCDLLKLATNKEYFICIAHWVWERVGGGPRAEMVSGEKLRGISKKYLQEVSDELFGTCVATPSSSKNRHYASSCK